MKKYINDIIMRCILASGILLLTFPSCDEDVLKETPLDFLAPENAYNTIPGIQQGLIGLHTYVRTKYYYGSSDVAIVMYGGGSDLAFHGEDPNATYSLCNYETNLLPEDLLASIFWTEAYKLIQNANALIAGINESDPNIWPDQDQKNAYLAEAMFFRAYAYRILVSFYGDVPLITEVIRSAKTDFVRTPKAEVYKQMEEDLIFGTVNLPEPGQAEAPGRITQGAAGHMLCEVYLADGKFQLAADAATEVIEGYNYALMTSRFGDRQNTVFSTGDVYYDLFSYGNHNLANNTEAIWVIQIEPLITGGGSNPSERVFGPAYFRMGNTPDGKKAIRGQLVAGKYTGYSDTLGRPVSWLRPTNYVVYDIWRSDKNNDIRNANHNIKRDFYFDAPGSVYDKQKIDFNLYPAGTRDAVRDTCAYIYPYFMKIADPCNHFVDPARSGGGTIHKDIYAIRLAETILLRAEAYVGLGRKDLAANDINLIRVRANATPVLEANVDLDYILDERARELYGEEWRHLTLRRMGKLVERVRLYNNNPKNPGLHIQDHHALFPIPQSEIDLNVNGVLEQNPGY